MKKGNKPDFHDAADAQTARRVYDHFYNKLRDSYIAERVKNGVFQAMMDVELKNDGPVGVDYRSEDAAVYFCPRLFLRRNRNDADLFLNDLQVTIEINTNLPKKEQPTEPKAEGTDKNQKKGDEGPTQSTQSFEFKIPAELLQ